MSKICSETFWMREPCRNINRMPFVRGFSLVMKGTSSSTHSRSLFLHIEQLYSHKFCFFAWKEKEDWVFRGLLQALSSLKLSIKQIHRNIFRFRKSFSKYRNISFSVHKVPFQISACWEICHKDSLCLITCPKAVFLSQQQASAPAVPNGPRYAAKDSLFPLLPPPSQESLH